MTIYRYFRLYFRRFPKISEHFRLYFRTFPKISDCISEDFRFFWGFTGEIRWEITYLYMPLIVFFIYFRRFPNISDCISEDFRTFPIVFPNISEGLEGEIQDFNFYLCFKVILQRLDLPQARLLSVHSYRKSTLFSRRVKLPL